MIIEIIIIEIIIIEMIIENSRNNNGNDVYLKFEVYECTVGGM